MDFVEVWLKGVSWIMVAHVLFSSHGDKGLGAIKCVISELNN
jgi:hypothetical protein